MEIETQNGKNICLSHKAGCKTRLRSMDWNKAPFPLLFSPSLVGCPKPSLSEPPYSWVSSKTNLPSENYRADRRWSRCPRSHRDHGICKLSETGIQHQGHHSLLCFTSQGEFRILNWVWPSWCTFESAGWLFEMKWENIATQSTMVS